MHPTEMDHQHRIDIDVLSPEIFEHEWEDDYPPRKDKRERVFRMLEYSHFPRTDRGQRRRTGYTRNESPSGLCLVTQYREEVGGYLRVEVQDVDGLPTTHMLAQIVWRERRPEGHYRLGLKLVDRAHSTPSSRIQPSPAGLTNSSPREDFCGESACATLPMLSRGERVGEVPFARLPTHLV